MDSGIWARFESKLDRLSDEVGTVREQLAGMAERFAPQKDVAALSERVALVEADSKKVMAAMAALAALTAGSIATAITQLLAG